MKIQNAMTIKQENTKCHDDKTWKYKMLWRYYMKFLLVLYQFPQFAKI